LALMIPRVENHSEMLTADVTFTLRDERSEWPFQSRRGIFAVRLLTDK